MPDLDDAALDAIEARLRTAAQATDAAGRLPRWKHDTPETLGPVVLAMSAAAADVPALVAALRAEREESRRWKRAFGNAEAEAKHARAEREAAIARAEAAEAAIAAVRALHTPRLIEYTHTANGPEDAVYECRECQQPLTAAVWPCATRRALDTGATT